MLEFARWPTALAHAATPSHGAAAPHPRGPSRQAHHPAGDARTSSANHALHERVVILSVETARTPRVPAADRAAFGDLGHRRRRDPSGCSEGSPTAAGAPTADRTHDDDGLAGQRVSRPDRNESEGMKTHDVLSAVRQLATAMAQTEEILGADRCARVQRAALAEAVGGVAPLGLSARQM